LCARGLGIENRRIELTQSTDEADGGPERQEDGDSRERENENTSQWRGPLARRALTLAIDSLLGTLLHGLLELGLGSLERNNPCLFRGLDDLFKDKFFGLLAHGYD